MHRLPNAGLLNVSWWTFHGLYFHGVIVSANMEKIFPPQNLRYNRSLTIFVSYCGIELLLHNKRYIYSMEATKVCELYFCDFMACKCLPRTFLSQNHGISTYITLGQSKIWRQWCQPNMSRKSIESATC